MLFVQTPHTGPIFARVCTLSCVLGSLVSYEHVHVRIVTKRFVLLHNLFLAIQSQANIVLALRCRHVARQHVAGQLDVSDAGRQALGTV